MFDIFDPRDGVTLRTVRFGWVARLICRFSHNRALDYAPRGQGWI